MQEVLADESQYYAGWSTLADWCRDLGRREEYLAATEALVRIEPQGSTSWGYLGDAQLMNEQPAAAAKSFERAFELDPQYEFAGNCVFDHQLENGDLKAAGETLRRLRLHSDSAFVLARAVQMAMRQRNVSEAVSLFRKICISPADSDWPVRAAYEAIADNRQGLGPAVEALRESLSLPAAHTAVGFQWIAATFEGDPNGTMRQLEGLRAATPAAEEATREFLNRMARSDRRLMLHRFVHANRAWLHASDRLWGSTGYALATMRDWLRCAEWMSDWRRRDGAQPWMLVNTAEALRSLGRDEEGIACSHYALTLPADGGTRLHHVLLMADAACAGDLPLGTAASRRR